MNIYDKKSRAIVARMGNSPVSWGQRSLQAKRRTRPLDYDLLNMLRNSQGPDKFQILMDQCVKDIKESLHIVGDGLATDNAEKIERGSHKLKSLAGTFGLEELYNLSVSTNEAFHKGADLDELKAQSSDLLASGRYSLKTLDVYISGLH